MLINKINEVTKLVSNYLNSSEIKKEINNFNRINSYIKSNIKLIEDYTVSIRTLNAVDKESFVLDNLSEHSEKLKTIQERIKKGIPVSENDFRYVFTSISGKVQNLKSSWESYASRKTEKLINDLESLKGLFEDKQKLLDLQFKLRTIKNRWPVNNVVVSDLNQIIHLSSNLIKELDLTQDIEDFIKMVMLGTATVEDLTPEILEWLMKKKFTNVLTISFASTKK